MENKVPIFVVTVYNLEIKKINLLKNVPPSVSSSMVEDSTEESEMDERVVLLAGRNPACNINFDHPTVSGFHLQIEIYPSSCSLYVTDLSSAHGTSISCKKVEPGVRMELNEGDTLHLAGSSRVCRLHWVPLSSINDIKDPSVPEMDSYTVEEKEDAIYQGMGRKPRVLLAACGGMASLKFADICSECVMWADVVAITTQNSLNFINVSSIPKEVKLYMHDGDWTTWKRPGDKVLHTELARWADIMAIAPLSTHTLAKIIAGLCDDLLTNVVRSWDSDKPLFAAPSMNKTMWDHSVTERHISAIEDEFNVAIITPNFSALDENHRVDTMADVSTISNSLKTVLSERESRQSSMQL